MGLCMMITPFDTCGHGSDAPGGWVGPWMSCTEDFVQIPCSTVFNDVARGWAKQCPNNIWGRNLILGGDDQFYRWTPGPSSVKYFKPNPNYDPSDPDSPMGTFVAKSVDGSWVKISTSPGTDLGASSLYWWQEFGRASVGFLIHGVRRDGETLGECINNNISNTTGGIVNPKVLADQALINAEAFWLAVTTIPVSSYLGGRPVSLLTQILLTAQRVSNMSFRAGQLLVGAGAFVGRAGAYAAAGTIGLVVGSTINYR